MLRIIKKPEPSKQQLVVIKITAVVLAFVASTVFILSLGHNPFNVYFSMLEGCFGSLYRFNETVVKTIPLAITALGILVAFKMKFWNIGGEGQILMGAFLASFFALKFPDMPMGLLIPLMIAAGMVGGGIWALIPAFFKARLGTNETLFTLMMNYIALQWVTYLQYGPWKDPNALGFPKIPNFSSNAVLPNVLGIHAGWIICLLLIAGIYVFMKYSKKGFEISVIGESETTALYAGMNVRKITLIAIFMSGALCGLAGMIQASAVSNTLSIEVAGGVGYTAIIVAWLSGLSAPIILLVSFLFATLVQGGAYIQTAFQIPQSAAQILQGMILIFVLGSEFCSKYKIDIKREKSSNNEDGARSA